MAKSMYIGVGGVARKVKKGYIGVGNVARKIKKAYIGIGGVARPFWSGGELTYYGTITSLNRNTVYLAAGTIGNHALFAGGVRTIDFITPPNFYNTVTAYDKSLVRSTPTALTVGQKQFDSAQIGSYLLFTGGNEDNIAVDAYNSSLTKSSVGGVTKARNGVYATKNTKYVLFCGGYPDTNIVDAYNAQLTYFSPVGLQVAAYEGRGTQVGKYALFGAGDNAELGYIQTATMQAYDEDLTRTVVTPLSQACCNLQAETVGNYGIFVCNGMANAYDANLSQSIITALSNQRRMMASVNFNDSAIFMGGWAVGNVTGVSTVDVYSMNLTRTTTMSISVGRGGLAATVLGDFAICAGGGVKPNVYDTTIYSTAEAFTLI